MSDSLYGLRSTWTRPLPGWLVGAFLGAAGRFLIAVSFIYYAFNWGGPFFRTEGGVSLYVLLRTGPLLLISAVLGLVAGGLGGVTRRPILGAAIGGGLSGMFCLGLFVLPANLLIGMSGGGAMDYSDDRSAIVVGLLAMILVGAVAGGVGAASGNRNRTNSDKATSVD
jgi:hypothetical protein